MKYQSKKILLTIRRVFSSLLIAVLLFSDAGTVVVYAQQLKTEQSTEKTSTLLTEDDKSSSLSRPINPTGIKSIMPDLRNTSSPDISASQMSPATVRKLKKEHYRPNEEISVTIENGADTSYTTELITTNGIHVSVETDETIIGDTRTVALSQPNSFRPGEYTLRITDSFGGVSEQNFSWGVLAINPDKSIYAPGETANLAIAVLNELGEMVCDAQVELIIKNPNGDTESLSTDNSKIKVNPECLSHDFTLKPDYETNYKTGGEGTYEMTLKSQTKNGSYTITDSFKVQKSVSFDVKRISATRIYPPHAYPVTMEITANQDFNGTVTETLTASFKVSRPGQEVLTEQQEIDAEIAASDSAKPRPVIVPPDNLPNAPIGFSTLNNLAEPANGQAVLGASVPNLGMPFAGLFPVSQEFGARLVRDLHDHDLYASFGMQGHDGIDFAMPQGTQLLAVDDGTIVLAGDGDYGKTIVIQHTWGKSYYGHLSSVDVKDGQQVARGAGIGKSGNTGISTGPHLHFGIRPKEDNTDNGYYGKADPGYYLGLKQKAGAVLAASTSIDEELGTQPTGDVQILTWKLNVKKGDKITIGYNYLAPRLSPQFYTLGPAVFTDTSGQNVFQENRKWQIAADALEMKMKRGSFIKSTSTVCAAPCTQKVAGLGFKPKAIILEWTNQTSETHNFSHAVVGMGLGTMSGGTAQERSVTFNSEDSIATSDTHTYRSATKIVVINNAAAGADITSVLAAADLVSFDSDGFTLSWSTNDTSATILHYTALGGSDVSNAKAGTFSLTTGTGSLAVTDPGFRPDFVTFLSGFTGAADTISVAQAHLNVGYAKSSTQEAASAVFSQDAAATALTFREQRTDASIILLSNTGTQDALADFTSMDATGFTLNKSDAPTGATEIYYLALQGGQYAVGSFNKNTTTGTQAVTGLGFSPSGVSFATDGNTTTTSPANEGVLSLGGASKDTTTSWCNDTTGTQCTSDWTNRRKISFNNSASAETIENLPVMVRLSSASANIDFDKTQFNGQDIRFVDPLDPNTVLSHEIEKWDEPGGEAIVWVKVPQIDVGSRTDGILMYYGNPSASDGQDVNATWDTHFRGVYHMADSSTTVDDDTSNGNDLSLSAAASWTTSGKLNGAWNGAGNNWQSRADDSDFDFAAAENFSISMWFKSDSATNPGAIEYLLNKSLSGGTQQAGYAIYANTTGTLCFGIDDDTTWTPDDTACSVADVYDGTWHHLVATKERTAAIRFYIDGSQVGSDATIAATGTLANDRILYVGDRQGADAGDEFNGDIDELRIAATLFSADTAEVIHVSENNTLNSFGPQETQAAGTHVYSEGSIALWDDHTPTTMAMGTGTTRSKALLLLNTPAAGSVTTLAEADMQSFDSDGFTLNWTTANATAQEIIYWAAGSVQATQEDYQWYKNTNAITPTTALEDANSSTIVPKNKATARLRANLSVGGGGLNASTQGFKLQYAANNAETAVGGTNDWCTDTTGVTCTSDWSARRKITFNNASASAALTDFPVMVKLSSASGNIDFNKTQFNGQDIRFVDPANPTEALAHEIEKWSEPGGEAIVWVKVPSLAAGTTDSILMYYGNSSAPDGQAATSVWDSDFKAVWHFKENPASTCSGTYEICDSTVNAVHGDMSGSMTSANQVAGQIDGSLTLDGTDDFIDFGDISGIKGVTNLTISTWMRRSSVGATGHFGKTDAAFTNNIAIEYYSDGKIYFYIADSVSNDTWATFDSNDTNWHHIVMRWDGNASTDATRLKGYVDGIERPLSYTGPIADISTLDSSTFKLGKQSTGFFPNRNDESRISTVTRSADWIEAEYITTSDQMNSFGQEQLYTSGGTSTPGWTDVADVWCNDTSGVTCNTSWSNRKRITIDNQSSTTALTNFPILVKLDSTRIDYTKTQSNGEDIRFVDPQDPTTVLEHEVESWNESGASYVWVEVPQLDAKSSSDSIWIYYGNASASSPATQLGNATHATGTWSNSYVGVWHLSENPNTAGAGGIKDATSNGNNGTDVGSMDATDTVRGQFGSAIDFDSVLQGIEIDGNPATLELDTTADWTITGWAKPTNFTTASCPIVYGYGNWGASLGITHTACSSVTGGKIQSWRNNATELEANSVMTAGAWNYLGVTRDASTTSFYLNGNADGTGASTTINNDTAGSAIGAIGDPASGGGGFYGSLDEIRVSNVVRSADWLRAEYQSGNDQMNTFGPEESQTSAVWKFKDNSSVTNGTTITSKVLSTSTAGDQFTYQESNPTALTPTNLAVGEKREWDFSLDGSLASARRTYYFRLVNADGTPLTSYTRYAQITVGIPNEKTMRGGKYFNYKQRQPFTF